LMAAVRRLEGTVNQVMGDGIMALFGAPLAHEDHAVRACYAALAMQEAMQRYAEETHGEIRRLLESITDARLAEPIRIPWFKDPPLTISVSEALTQCAMHSHHHRGQNATRLRELGGVPPSTDLIVWYWKQRPAAEW